MEHVRATSLFLMRPDKFDHVRPNRKQPANYAGYFHWFDGISQVQIETISKGLGMKGMGAKGRRGSGKDGRTVKSRLSMADSRIFVDAWRYPCLRSLSHRVKSGMRAPFLSRKFCTSMA